MSSKGIEKHLEEYSGWRTNLFDSVDELRAWLKDQDLGDARVDQRLDQVMSNLRDDKLYVAFVAEFSRGKSELINAIFFANFGQRILPSAAGRTTMCPTELQYDLGTKPCLRLLPVETRKGGTTISEYRRFNDEWQEIPLDVKNSDSMIKALRHVVEIKEVTTNEAEELGFHIAHEENEIGLQLNDDGLVEVPKWRHAIINYPHPLLEQGLVILDTPGLNALGAEPELTLNMLPSAHAVLFILAADAGVTKSDIDVWHDHISQGKGSNKRGRMVVLNKIDGLWDDLKSDADVNGEIDRQIRETAKILSLSDHNVYPVSAQKGLYGKIKNDQATLERSQLLRLENALGSELIPDKRGIVRDNVAEDLESIIKAVRALIGQRLKGVYEHIDELSSLNGKNIDVIEHMMNKVQEDKAVFEKSMQRFQATRSIFSQQTNVLYTHLNLKALDKRIAETRKDMRISLTTSGLKALMISFFKETTGTMEQVSKQAQEIKELMEGVYKKFQEEHGLSNIKPGHFSVMRYMREIKRLQDKHEQFVRSLSFLRTEQKTLTDQFFDSSVAKIRMIYKMANKDADAWLKTIMSPMEAQVREHQIQLRRRLESIKRIHQASDTLEDRLKELEHIRDGIRNQETGFEKRADAIIQALRDEGGQTQARRA
ncbi:MAG: dynamin family protein [Gammaproteobacteria bacterium]|nr:dynamin family protein [Gammaproteobacteria bacterium]